jgi:putative Holliday junction resolvase
MADRLNRTFLGIDYGERRVGIAKSDPTGLIASALTTLETRSLRDAVAQISTLIKEHEPDGIVVGYPVQLSGERSEKCKDVDAFVMKLAEIYDGPIHTVDESYSSVEAADVVHAHGQRVGKDKRRLDRLAAVIILQRFLDELPRS